MLENILNDEENNDECTQLDEEEVMDLQDVFGGIIRLPLQTVKEADMDKESFLNGVKGLSHIAGQVTALTNAGVPANEALVYLMNLKLAYINLEITKLKCKAQVETAKHMKKNMEDDIL